MKYLLTGQETERLIFRPQHRDDFAEWLPAMENPDTERFLGMTGITSAEARCETWFQRVENRYQNDLGGTNVLVDKSSGKIVGQCGLLVQEVDDILELEIGYTIIPAYWNQGYATEAARKCKEFAFENNFAESIISIIHIENIQSEMVARKNGMQLDKTTTFKGMPVNIFRIHRSI
ncbi:MAG: GNAT family N-acetyltransferase [Saprospiraceae bacterium]|nr:GNAT family N-acetyltransferase [Saprospiraceae bacterium]